MPFIFRPAKREGVSLLIGLAGGTGSGKTYTAMRLAKGICGADPFGVIDTEAGRAKHYADQFRFDHGDLTPPFTPDAYADAIEAADKAGYKAILLDSMSHEWAGDGGILDWQDAELDRMAGDDWKKREACKMAAWIKPKGAHKRMVQRLLQVRAHLILCFRAEPKVEIAKVDGKTVIREKQSLTGLNGWIPVTEKNLPFELTASFLLMADRPGVPLPIKLQEQHKALFPLTQPITEDSGRRLAEWAAGSAAAPSAAPAAPPRDDIRAARLARIAQAGAARGLDRVAARALWEKHCGRAKPEAATTEQLTALLADLEREPVSEAAEPAEEDIPWGG